MEFRIFCPFSPHSAAFPNIWGNAFRYAYDGVYGLQEGYECNKGLIEAIWKLLFNFILWSFAY